MKIPFIKKCLLLLLLVASGSMAMGEDTYQLVTSDSELESGALYVIVSSNAEGSAYGLGNQKTTSTTMFRDTIHVTVSADLTVNGDSLCPLKLTKVAEDKWTLYDDKNKVYLKWISGNSLPSGDLDNSSYFSITIESDSSTSIKCKKDATRVIQYNSGFPRFACYTGSQRSIYLYKQSSKKVENPVFNPEGGTQDKPTRVEYGKEISVSTSTEEAKIYIKNDDVFNLLSQPIIASSKLFSVVVKATKTDLEDSEEVTGWYAAFISAPTFSISDTMVVKNTPLLLNCSTSSDATVYYRINDKEYEQYTSPIIISDDCTISAYAMMLIDGEEWKSDISSVKYTIKKPIIRRCVFKETFDDVTGNGGNDSIWNGGAGNSSIDTSYAHYRDWLFTKAYKASQCLKIGTGRAKGSVTTPSINYAGEVLLTFRAGAWNADNEKLSITVSIGGKINQEYSLDKGKFSDYSLKIENFVLNDKILFSAKVTSNNRFFLDDICVYAAIKDTTSYTDYVLNGYWTCEDMGDLFDKNPNITHLDLSNMEREEGIKESIPKNSNCLIFTTDTLGLEKNEVIGGNCANLVLTDNLPYSIKEEFTATNASYSRSAYRDGGWETLMVPYDVTNLPDGYLFEKFVEIQDNEVTFQPVDSLVAHTPYIMKYIGDDAAKNAKDNNFSLSATNIMISVDPGQSLAFKGTDTEISGEGKYILNADGTQFGKGTADSKIKPFHAYLEIENQNKAPAYRVIHATDQATAMDKVVNQLLRIHSDNGSILIECQNLRTIDIYSLDGWLIRRVDLYPGKNHIDGLAPGIYLINRQKVCVN